MNKKLLVTILLISLLVLTSCQSGIGRVPQSTNYFTGTKALTVDFLDQAPPGEVFETSEFDVQLYIHNQGAFSLTPPYVALVDLTYDNGKVDKLEDYSLTEQPTAEELAFLESLFGTTAAPAQTYSKGFIIEGKNINWINGEQKYVSLARFKAKEIPGNFQTNNVAFIAQLCYPYETTFISEICIDTDTEGTSQRDEVCEKQDRRYSSGQGAPIAITAVESQMIPRGVYVQPQFTIHIEQKGDGVASFREVTAESYDPDSCQEIPQENINKLSVQAFLAGDELTCLPQDVILKGGKAKIQCQLTEDKILGVSSNYMTSLIVNVGYLYSESFRKNIVVQKSAGTAFEDSQTQEITDCFAWQTYDNTQEKCINTCDYKATYHQEFSQFSSIAAIELSEDVPNPQNYIWTQVSCNYKSLKDCKDNPQLCIEQNGLCPPGDFCGLPTCLLNNRPPTIADRVRIGDGTLSFTCVDADDTTNIKQTCGCTSTAYYGFINKTEQCDEDSYNTPIPGDDKNLYGIVFEIDNILSEDKKDKRLCVKVEDKLGKETVLSLVYPFS